MQTECLRKNPIEKCWFWREVQEQEQEEEEIPSPITNIYMPIYLFIFFLGVFIFN